MPFGSVMSDSGWSGIGRCQKFLAYRQFQSWSPWSSQKYAPPAATRWFGPEERVELAGQPALGHGEREPAGLGPVRIVARRRVELVVGVRCRHTIPF